VIAPNRTKLFLTALLLSGCIHPIQTQNQLMNSWLHHSRDELVSKWGPPSSILQDGIYQMYIYTETETATKTTPGIQEEISNGPDRAVTTTRVVKQRTFWLDAGGTIRKWSWRGL
jgi:hypothetical protein